MTLDKYYRYWDEFVCEWKNFMSGGGNIASWCHYTHLSQWLYPSFCNNIDKNNSSTPTIDYLPDTFKNGVAKAYIFDGDDEKVLYFDEKGNIINK